MPRSREEAVRAIESRWGHRGGTALMYAGDYHLAVSLCAADASEHERSGRVAAAVLQRAFGARGSIALGRFSDACAELSQARPLAERLPPGAMAPFQLGLSELFLHSSEGTEFDPLILREDVKWRVRFGATRDNQNVWAATQAWAARALAILGERETALAHLREALPAMERAPGWAPNYPLMTARVAEALWVLGADDHASTVERNVKAKVLERVRKRIRLHTLGTCAGGSPHAGQPFLHR